MTTIPLKELEAERERIKAQLAELSDMRPGSLVERYRKCGQPGCRCAREGSRGHGPSWSLTRAVAGKTVTKVIPSGLAVERTREQIKVYRRFRELAQELVELNVRICDRRLQEGSEETFDAQKNSARRRSGRGRRPRG